MILCVELDSEGSRSVPCPAQSLAESARYEPMNGVYTVDRTYPAERVLYLDRHFDRLESSADREGIPLRIDRSRVRAALRDLLRKSHFDSGRFRISVPSDGPGVVRITMEQFRPVPDSIRQGVRCSLVDARRHHPESKTLGWMHQRTDSPLPEGVYEGLLVSMTGEILEGLSSNFFGILDGTLRTAGHGVLQGVSRHIVLEVAVGLLPVRLKPIRVAEIARCEEAFLTSSTRGVIPIIAIDDDSIGPGHVGPRTSDLAVAYTRWVDGHLEPLVP